VRRIQNRVLGPYPADLDLRGHFSEGPEDSNEESEENFEQITIRGARPEQAKSLRKYVSTNYLDLCDEE